MSAIDQTPAVAQELLKRLPRSFVPTLNEQLRQWDLLFPAERRTLSGQLEWLAALPSAEFNRLLEPVRQLEGRMNLPHWDANTPRASIADSALLARSALYPQWRAEVERVFGVINEGAASASPPQPAHRLIVTVLPPGIPLSGALWPGFSKKGRWVNLRRPFGECLPDFVLALARRKPSGRFETVERTWLFESSQRWSAALSGENVNALSFEGLTQVRREFLSHLNTMGKNLRSADETYEELRRLDLGRFLTGPWRSDLRLRELVRSLLLSGNGALVFGNSFVQWCSSELLRRVQPEVLIGQFGMRAAPKPFTSITLFEDQNRSNPAPDREDPQGSFVDAHKLSEYVHLSAGRLVPFRQQTLGILAAADLDRVLLVGGPPAVRDSHLGAGELAHIATTWLTAAL